MGGGGVVNFKFQSPPVEGGSEKLKKGWKFGVGAGLLKRRGLALFLFIFFQGLSFLWKLRYSLQNCVMHLKKKILFLRP